jgi:putative flippase GtrA
VIRFLRFNGVGVIGSCCTARAVVLVAAAMQYLAATALGSSKRPCCTTSCGRALDVARSARGVRKQAQRLGRFHLLNGSVSLAGNLVLMRLLVGELGVPHLAANVCAVVACSLINFLGSEPGVRLRAPCYN